MDSVLSKIGRIRSNIIRRAREQNLNSNIMIRKTQEELEEALSSSLPDPAALQLSRQHLRQHIRRKSYSGANEAGFNGSTVETEIRASSMHLKEEGGH